MSGFSVVVVIEVAGRDGIRLFVTIVRESSGMLSFLVRRMDAAKAFEADRRARSSGARGIRRFIVLFSLADWIV